MRLLFTSAGRRVELMQAFRDAAARLGVSLEIFGTDISDTAPALFFCDKAVISPRISDESYIPFLKKLCLDNEIGALIPTIDTDLLVLAKNRTGFGNTKVVVSGEKEIALCRDKLLTAGFFRTVGLKTPTPCDDYRVYDGGYPAFIKPKDGSSGIHTYKVNNAGELKAYAGEVPNYIVAPFIDGTEYTVDAFCGFDGRPVCITPRIRLAVRAGEVLKTQIAQDERIIEETKRIIESFKPCGAVTVQLIRQNGTGDDYYIEINPRFGGGAPLSIKAGADSAEALLRILSGETLAYRERAAEDGAVFSRFDQSVRVK